jgi:hypothetical protein
MCTASVNFGAVDSAAPEQGCDLLCVWLLRAGVVGGGSAGAGDPASRQSQAEELCV